MQDKAGNILNQSINYESILKSSIGSFRRSEATEESFILQWIREPSQSLHCEVNMFRMTHRYFLE